MSDTPTILGPDGQPATPPPLPSWVQALRPGLRVVIAGWWFKVEDPVTNGEGQWAMILSAVVIGTFWMEAHKLITFKRDASG